MDQPEISEVGGLAGVGVGSYGISRVLREYARNAKQVAEHTNGIGTLSGYRPRVGDIMLQTPAADVFDLKDSLTGNSGAMHGMTVMPSLEGSGVRGRAFASDPAKLPQFIDRLAATLDELKKDTLDKLLHPVRTWRETTNVMNRINDRSGKLTTDKKVRSILNESMDLKEFKDFAKEDDRVVRILRPKDKIDSAGRTRMLSNEMDTAYMRANDSDQLAHGIRNFLGFSGKGKPRVCVGGVCSVFDGVRDVPSPSSALGADIIDSKDFETVFANRVDSNVGKRMLSGTRLRAGVRGGLPAALIAGGGYLAYPWLSGGSQMNKESASMSGLSNYTRRLVNNIGESGFSSKDLLGWLKDNPTVPAGAAAAGGAGGLLTNYALGDGNEPIKDIASGAAGGAIAATTAGSTHQGGRRKFNELLEAVKSRKSHLIDKKFGPGSRYVSDLGEYGVDSYDGAKNLINEIKQRAVETKKNLAGLDQAGLDRLLKDLAVTEDLDGFVSMKDDYTSKLDSKFNALTRRRFNRFRGPVGAAVGIPLALGLGAGTYGLSDYAT